MGNFFPLWAILVFIEFGTTGFYIAFLGAIFTWLLGRLIEVNFKPLQSYTLEVAQREYSKSIRGVWVLIGIVLFIIAIAVYYN